MIPLPGYAVTTRIHEGHTTLVYRGRRSADGAKVVIRVLRREYPTAREIASLAHEYGLLRDLTAPGVVRALALEPCGNGLALVLEDAGELTLASLLHRERPDLQTALRIAANLAETLEGVHRRGVIHKDIKPHHVVIRPGTADVRLIGFSIATRLSQETQQTVSPEAVEGTLAYMSPEQTGRMNRVVDRRTDLYSLGVTLYELFTGTLPFDAAEPMELVHCHVARTPAPPRQRAPWVPRAVSRLVMKLLAKNAEDRYQSAFGVKADLAALLERVRSGDPDPDLALGGHDRPDTLHIPQKLYGRAAEERALLSAFERAGAGAVELVLVSGYSGIGKSALVNEIHKAIAREGGALAFGKFDQLARSVPYASIAQAFRELLRQVLSEPPDRLARRKEALLRAAGPNGQLLIELIPELELVIGPQPAALPLGPAESQVRFHELLQRFVRAFAGPGSPLALFLDDLQWSDPGSLKLLEVLLADPEATHLLVIGAYRDNEVDASHPLMLSIGALRKAGVTINEIVLKPLALSDVVDLLADTLGHDRPTVAPLARVVLDRTQSNPFFLKQFLIALHAEGLLRFDAEAGAWTWDLKAIQARPATENVVDFMARKIARLAPPVRRVLELAACIGHEFDLRTLSVIHEQRLLMAASTLWTALQEGLVVPVDADYRLAHVPQEGGAHGGEGDLKVRYRFLHDRVQQAAYSLIDEELRKELHLRIGRLMSARAQGAARDEALFDIVGHLNLGAALMDSDEERAAAAELNLAAGRKAMSSAAHAAAAGYFRSGMALLPEGAWSERYPLALALYKERAEAEYLSGGFEEADRLYPVALAHARTAMDKVGLYFVQSTQYQLQGRYAEAIGIQRAGLALLGLVIPEETATLSAMLAAKIADVDVHLAGRRIEDLVQAPLMKSPEHRAMMELLQGLFYAAYLFGDQTLANLALVKMTTLSLQHGSSELSPFGYIGYGMVADALLGDFKTGYRFARMAIDLSEQFVDVGMKCKANFLFAADVHNWTQPIQGSDVFYDKAYALGMESGDWVTMGYMIIQSGADRLIRGMPLPELYGITQAHLAFLRRAKNQDVIDLLRAGVIQPILNLEGRTRGPHTFDGPDFSEAAYLDRYGKLPYYQAWLYYAKIRSAYLVGDRSRWPELAEKLAVVESALPTHAKVPETTFYTALIHLASCDGAGEAGRREHLGRALPLLSRLEVWAEAGPSNVLHKHLLAQAELARVEGRRADAMDLYERAIASAADNDYINTEALGNELYARFWLDQGRDEIGQIFLRKALHLYDRWGAAAKVQQLSERHPELLPPRATERPPAPAAGDVMLTTPRELPLGELLDLETVLRAGQAISSEIELDKVLERVMPIVLHSAGATRGLLLLARGEALFVEAMMSTDPDVVSVGPSAPMEERGDLPRAIAHYVARTRDAVVLDGCSADPRFAGDDYIAAQRPRSVLCLALLHQGRLTGILYLENRLAGDAFSPDRIELLKLLSSQAAVALENALLYTRVQKVSEALKQANDRLELDVRQRTEELRASNERLVHELGERTQAEAERAALQDEIIRMQQAQLAELSTPLIPITHDVVVMPLVGSMDLRRAEQVLATALTGAARSRARVVILDVTGLRHVDSGVAGTLIRAASALRLIGAEAVVTGVRPEVAQTLVKLDIDLGSVVLRSTLQSGIAYATSMTVARR